MKEKIAADTEFSVEEQSGNDAVPPTKNEALNGDNNDRQVLAHWEPAGEQPEANGAVTEAPDTAPINQDDAYQGDPNWRDGVPRSVVRTLERAAIDPKHPERGGVDLDGIRFRPRNDGKLKSRNASEAIVVHPRDEVLKGYLVSEITVLIGSPDSKAGTLALAIAQAVATGKPVLGQTPVRGSVLYVDPVRPFSAVSAALTEAREELSNLFILASDSGDGVTDDSIRHEVRNLKSEGIDLRLVVINEVGRFTRLGNAKKFLAAVGETSCLLVTSDAKFTMKKYFRSEPTTVVDMMANENVITLQAYAEGSVRLGIFRYGELTADMAVEPTGAWVPLGDAKDGVRGKRQQAAYEAIKEAGQTGLEPREVAAYLSITPTNAYQALMFLTRANRIFKQGSRYYPVGVSPSTEPSGKEPD